VGKLLWRWGHLLWLLAAVALLKGGLPGLVEVPLDAWGGLPLTLCIFIMSLLASVPLGVGLALARRAERVWWSWPATCVIELVRGVPLVTLLFMAAFLLPMLIPLEHPLPLFWRCLLALTLFSSVYLAEVVRAGLQTVAKEQSEAANILGLSWWQTQRLVVLPQALRAMLPALVGHAIGLLKDSSLVMVVGLHELTGGLSLSLGGDPLWRPYYFEAYLFVGLIYGLMCLALARAGRWLEARWAKGTH
jgi:general L-amino acid transport system permease protein